MRAQAQTTVIAVLIVGLIIGAAVGYLMAPGKVTTTTVTSTVGEGATATVTTTVTTTVQAGAQLPDVIPIGALLPLQGDLASYGENSKEAILQAEEDVNAFLQAIGAPFRINVRDYIEDTETKPDVAVQKFNALVARGVKVIIGPQTSAEVRKLRELAGQNKVLLISQSSTATDLAIPGDYVFRLCTADNIQGPVIAKAMAELGIKAVVPLIRADTWGIGLERDTLNAYRQLVPDGEVATPIEYDPEKANFAQVVEQVKAAVEDFLNKGYTADQIGVLFIAFAEAAEVFTLAANYDVLAQVRWFGSDGTALLSEITDDPVAAEFAAKIRFLNTIFTVSGADKYEKVRERILNKLGREPDSYAYAAYDGVWLATLAVLMTGQYDADVIKSVLPVVAENFFGATGLIIFNEAGDRAFADYDMWEVQYKDGEYQWVLVGKYNYLTDSFTWFTEQY